MRVRFKLRSWPDIHAVYELTFVDRSPVLDYPLISLKNEVLQGISGLSEAKCYSG